MRKCPKCGSPRVHRSRSRGLIERLRKSFSQKRPHRCHACGWRGWGFETQEAAEPEKATRGRAVPDFGAIDVAVEKAGRIEVMPAPSSGGGDRVPRH